MPENGIPVDRPALYELLPRRADIVRTILWSVSLEMIPSFAKPTATVGGGILISWT